MARGNNQGSIYQRKSDGKWCAAITLEGQKRKVLYGKTRKEVADKLNTALNDQRQGLPVAVERQTVAQFFWTAGSPTRCCPASVRARTPATSSLCACT